MERAESRSSSRRLRKEEFRQSAGEAENKRGGHPRVQSRSRTDRVTCRAHHNFLLALILLEQPATSKRHPSKSERERREHFGHVRDAPEQPEEPQRLSRKTLTAISTCVHTEVRTKIRETFYTICLPARMTMQRCNINKCLFKRSNDDGTRNN